MMSQIITFFPLTLQTQAESYEIYQNNVLSIVHNEKVYRKLRDSICLSLMDIPQYFFFVIYFLRQIMTNIRSDFNQYSINPYPIKYLKYIVDLI